jgi:hypothetical protein
MRRRDFLIGGMAYPAATALSRVTPATASPLPQKIVDVHCHIFNSLDLPMVEFIDKAYLRNAVSDPTVAPYTPLIDAILADLSKRLRAETKDDNSDRSLNACLEYERQFVTRLFRDWKKNSVPLPTSAQGMALLDILDAYLPTIVFGFLRRELSPGNFSGPKDFSLNSVLDNSDEAFTLGPEFDSDYLAGQIYEQDTSDKIISHSISWGVIFTRSRRELADQLNRVNNDRAVLATPAMVDFSKWLDASSDKTTTLADQVAAMGRLSHEDRPGQPRIHGFVASIRCGRRSTTRSAAHRQTRRSPSSIRQSRRMASSASSSIHRWDFGRRRTPRLATIFHAGCGSDRARLGTARNALTRSTRRTVSEMSQVNC